jgi:hypothetical protein
MIALATTLGINSGTLRVSLFAALAGTAGVNRSKDVQRGSA